MTLSVKSSPLKILTCLCCINVGTYLTGSAHHWRREERESGRDIFLNQQEEGSKSREYRCAIQESCHAYVREACQRNRGEALDVNLDRIQNIVNMSHSDGEKFLSAFRSDPLGVLASPQEPHVASSVVLSFGIF